MRTEKQKVVIYAMGKGKSLELNWDKLEGMLLFDASLNVCAYELKMSHDTLERRIKERFGKTFAEYRREITDRTVLKLKTKMINQALEGDRVCMIFALKNLSDWNDRVEHEIDREKNQIVLRYNLEDTSMLQKEVVQIEPKESKDDNSSDR